MRTRTFVGLLSCIALVICLYVNPAARAATAEEEVLQVVTNFATAMNTNDTELMGSLWWNSPKTSTFGPPKGLAFLTQGWDSIMMWMKDLNKYPVGTYTRTIQNPQVMMLGDNVAVLTTYSIFTQNPPAVKEQTTGQERMTFVVQKIGGKWLIVHGHGSIFPTE
jgi:uncharacterized protein (TIGR02246 family)